MSAHIITLRLTLEQSSLLGPLLERQSAGKDTAVLSLVSSSYEPDTGESVLKLQLAWLPRRLASKIVGLIREAEGRQA
jgi:hypothetical protein